MTRPLVYACAGCSAAAQLANAIAVRLDRSGLAEMSCIAGVGGDVPSLVRTARSGRPMLVIDGCPLDCARRCLARHAITATRHVRLADLGVEKGRHAAVDPDDVDRLLPELVREIEEMTVD